MLTSDTTPLQPFTGSSGSKEKLSTMQQLRKRVCVTVCVSDTPSLPTLDASDTRPSPIAWLKAKGMSHQRGAHKVNHLVHLRLDEQGWVFPPKMFLYWSTAFSEGTLGFLWKVHTHCKKYRGTSSKDRFPLDGKFGLRSTQVLLMALRVGFQQIPTDCTCKDPVYTVASVSVHHHTDHFAFLWTWPRCVLQPTCM